MPTLPQIQRIPGPSDLTTFTIKVDGNPLPGTYAIRGVDIERTVNRIPSLRLVLQDGDAPSQDFEISSGDVLVPGNEIEIKGGYASDENILFKGIITKQRIEVKRRGTSLLHIEAKDPAFRMALARKSRYFTELSDSDLFDEIIGDYAGLTADIESTSTTYPEIVQVRVSDWDFLVTRAEKVGMLCLVEDGTIGIRRPDLSSDPGIQLTYGSNIFDLDLEMDARTQLPSVTSAAWDAANQEILSGEADDVAAPDHGNIDGSELAEVGEVEDLELRHTGSLQQGELQSWAEAQLTKSRFSKIRGSVRFQGSESVVPGGIVELSGLGDRFNGKAFVSGVRHMLGEGDWVTTVEIGLDPDWHIDRYAVSPTPASAFHPAVSGLQIGVVTQLEDDPDGEDRIQVRIPMVDPGADGTWSRMAVLDAGNERGSFFRPEIDDEVVVAFLNDDPHEPIVLGMLNSSAKPAPMTASDDNHEKGFVTRSGMKLVFNDDEPSLTLETPNGNKVVLHDGDGEITLEDESGNKITMNSDGISLDSAKDIVLKAANDLSLEALNVKIKASASAELEGSASAALKSGGNTEVKGSIVQIN